MDSTNQKNPNNALPECPECDRAIAVKDKSQSIGEFLEWMELEKGLVRAYYDEDYNVYRRAHGGIEKLLAEYFEIDLDKVEREKRRLLAKLQVINQP